MLTSPTRGAGTHACRAETHLGAWFFGFCLVFQFTGRAAPQEPSPPVQLTAQQDHQRMRDLLHIKELRPGADGRNTQAPNYANYDESKANPYPNLPDPLLLKNGKKVKTAKDW